MLGLSAVALGADKLLLVRHFGRYPSVICFRLDERPLNMIKITMITFCGRCELLIWATPTFLGLDSASQWAREVMVLGLNMSRECYH